MCGDVSLSVFHEELSSACNGTTPTNRLLKDAHSDEAVTFIRDESGADIGYKIQERGIRSINYLTNTVVNPYLERKKCLNSDWCYNSSDCKRYSTNTRPLSNKMTFPIDCAIIAYTIENDSWTGTD